MSVEAQTGARNLGGATMHVFVALCLSLSPPSSLSRRAAIASAGASFATLAVPPALAEPLKIEFTKAPSGVEYADLRAGSGAAASTGQRVVIDYMMTRRGGAKIYSTTDEGRPFSWTIGDGSVIVGLEQAVLGTEDVPPLLPGGVRRVIVPEERGYGTALKTWETAIKDIGPIPPEFTWTDKTGDKVNAYVRFKNIYQNKNRIDQPDLLLDVKLLRVEPLDAPMPAPAAAAPAAAAGPSADPEEELRQLKEQLAAEELRQLKEQLAALQAQSAS